MDNDESMSLPTAPQELPESALATEVYLANPEQKNYTLSQLEQEFPSLIRQSSVRGRPDLQFDAVALKRHNPVVIQIAVATDDAFDVDWIAGFYHRSQNVGQELTDMEAPFDRVFFMLAVLALDMSTDQLFRLEANLSKIKRKLPGFTFRLYKATKKEVKDFGNKSREPNIHLPT